ncbi:MAG: 16S rRNA (cytosine(1402)-N(4))-methyltransferase RsmH [bacterium]|nr:16S rRNA (cytosine(1402)-N(4))-methyltransferase RsmH [bacterium]
MFLHKPVMPAETLSYLAVAPGQVYIDCTTGEGGHSELILKQARIGRLICIEQDDEILQKAKERLRSFGNVIFIHDNFQNLRQIAERLKLEQVHGILFDLGLSVFHYKKSDKGFSFERDSGLDMRLNEKLRTRASDIVNRYHEQDLIKLIWAYGEERWTKPIVHRICEYRKQKKIETTVELKELIERAVPRKFWKRWIHPATQTFQALRIAVNNELYNLEKVLDDGISLLAPGGRMVVISYHSLEDRIVKNKFRLYSRGIDEKGQEHPEIRERVRLLTKKPVIAGPKESGENPSSRSGKLRAVEKAG